MTHKSGNIGIVVGQGVLRATQRVDGRIVHASVAVDEHLDNLKKSLRQLLAEAPFAGRQVVLGLEGDAVLVESLVVAANQQTSVKAHCADRLRGDPVFDPDKVMFGVSTGANQSGQRGALAVLAAIVQERLDVVIKTCREMELVINAVEAAPLAAWRAWSGTGPQARLVRSENGDVLLAGEDEQLLFSRVVPETIPLVELRDVLARAAGLIGCDSFERLEATGLSDADMQILSGDLGISVVAPAEEMADVIALGLATEGAAAIDFTPPEERDLREGRRLRKMRIGMSGVVAALVLSAGIVGVQQENGLEDQKDALQAKVVLVHDTKTKLDGLKKDIAKDEANETIIEMARPGHRISTLFQVLMSSGTSDVSFGTISITDIEDPSIPAEVRKKAETPLPRVLDVQINGLAATGLAVTAYVDALMRTEAFEWVRTESSEKVLLGAGVEGERFRIHALAETR